jgi:hypothetical protein
MVGCGVSALASVALQLARSESASLEGDPGSAL